MAYVDVMVLPVKKSGKEYYVKMVKAMAKAWKDCGALAYTEMWAEDVKPGKATSFPQSLHLAADEEVVVALLTFRNKAARDKAWGKFMKHPVMGKFDRKDMPFDMQRTFFGGFLPIVKFQA